MIGWFFVSIFQRETFPHTYIVYMHFNQPGSLVLLVVLNTFVREEKTIIHISIQRMYQIHVVNVYEFQLKRYHFVDCVCVWAFINWQHLQYFCFEDVTKGKDTYAHARTHLLGYILVCCHYNCSHSIVHTCTSWNAFQSTHLRTRSNPKGYSSLFRLLYTKKKTTTTASLSLVYTYRAQIIER